MLRRPSENRICAFCKLDHRVYIKKEVSFFDAMVLLAVAGLMSFAIWGEPDLRSLLIFMTLAFILQVFLRLRYRESVKCPHCGFDPILYNHDHEQAAQKVKAFLEKRKNNPKYMLKPQPRVPAVYKSRNEIMAEAEAKLKAGAEPNKPLPEAPTSDTPPFIDTLL